MAFVISFPDYPKFKLADANSVNAEDLRVSVKVKISILPELEVGVGAVAFGHLIETPEPLTFTTVGLRPVDPCVTNRFILNVLPSVVGALVIFTVRSCVGVLLNQKMLPVL